MEISSAATANRRTSWMSLSRRAADGAAAGEGIREEAAASGEVGSSEARGGIAGVITGSKAEEGDGGTAPKGRAPETTTSPSWRETGEQTSSGGERTKSSGELRQDVVAAAVGEAGGQGA